VNKFQFHLNTELIDTLEVSLKFDEARFV